MGVEEKQARQEQATTNFKAMYGGKKVQAWARLGTTLWLDAELVKTDLKQAVIKALTEGDAMLDGETYFPDCDVNEEIALESEEVDFYDKIKVEFTGKGD